MSFADQKTRKTESIVLVAGVHAVLGAALLYGLAERFTQEPTTILQTENVPIELPPPPEPVEDPRPMPRSSEVALPRPEVPVPPSPNPLQTVEPTDLPQTTLTTLPTLPLTQIEPVVPTVEPPPAGRPAAARGNPGDWIAESDYPTRALRDGREGTVSLRWDISVAGRVENCVVVASSGSPDLDQAACRAMERRGRYTPARDAGGNPVRAEATQRIRWRLPAD